MGAQLRSDVSYSIMWSVHAMCRVTRAHAAAFNGSRQVGVDQPIWSELRTIEQAKEFASKVGGCLPSSCAASLSEPRKAVNGSCPFEGPLQAKRPAGGVHVRLTRRCSGRSGGIMIHSR